MRFAITGLLVFAAHLANAQTTSSARAPSTESRKSESAQAQYQIVVDTVERGMLAVRRIPDSPLPRFDDPLPRTDQQRVETLYQEFFTSVQKTWVLPDRNDPQFAARYTAIMQQFAANLNSELTKFFRARVDEAAKFGDRDPRYIAALEDAGIELRGRDPQASSYLDKAARLREAEGPKSVDFWKDLQRLCVSGITAATRDLSPCERAIEVRLAQPDATPLELASRQQSLADYESMYGNRQRSAEYQQKAAELYAKAGAFLPMAARFRNLTEFALLSHDVDRIVQLNDLTNRYLALGDAAARRLILPSGTLRLLEGERHSANPPAIWSGVEPPPTADQLLDRYLQAEHAIRSGQVTTPISFDYSSVARVIVNLTDPAICTRADESAASSDAMNALMKSTEPSDSLLALSSANIFASTSIVQSVCGSPGNAVPGYAAMLHSKGIFAEMVAPRKLTVLPGFSKERTEAVQALDGAFFRSSLALLPPGEQQHILSLPPNSRAQAVKDYVAAHPEAGKDADAMNRMRQAMASGWAKSLTKAGELTRDEVRQANLLAVLDMLRAGEAFVDVYKYRIREGDRFAAEHYLAVISTSSKSSRLIQLGSAEPIDAAVASLLTGFAAGRPRGSGSEARGVRLSESGESHPAEAWKSLQRLLVQPILAALPAGTRKILLSPDSSLALAPFPSLLLDMGSPVAVSIVPSAYDCARLKSAPAPTGAARAVVVGGLDYATGTRNFNPLPGTESELKNVAAQASAAGFQTVTLTGSQATRAVIFDRIRDARLLHLATHGFWSTAQSASAADAFRSAGLALSQANSGSPDALLTAADILKLDLSQVQLVVLSACTSGQGRPVDGQGLLGFQTAFMAAGAQSLLLSLWNVPDRATAVLMQRFYQALFAAPSISKSEALRQAQQQLRADPEFADPRNWAAWIVVGDAL